MPICPPPAPQKRVPASAAKSRLQNDPSRKTLVFTAAALVSAAAIDEAQAVADAAKWAMRAFLKTACTTLSLHVDSDKNTELRGQLLATSTIPSGSAGFVIVPGQFGPTAAGFSKSLDPHKIPGYVKEARRVPAPAGSFIFWHPNAVHANCGHGNKLTAMDPRPITITLDEAEVNPDVIHDIVESYGVCVVTGLLTQKESKELVNDAANAVLESRTDPYARGVKPMGFNGCMLAKSYGISVNPLLMNWMVHVNVIALWEAVLGTPDICFSPDALAIALDPDADYDPHHPTRVALILCFGRNQDQVPGTGAKKLDRILHGKQCNHPPTGCEPGGGGDHMSNRMVLHPTGKLEKFWKVQTSPRETYSDFVIKYLGQ
jgi:hypothetical protein